MKQLSVSFVTLAVLIGFLETTLSGNNISITNQPYGNIGKIRASSVNLTNAE
ncbi:hypothetical protein [Phormidium sp. CCY1219]|uniref:hypothetical protein n=1 Tax=Phormidium sp. CCY1219 TaxID=2886104 RepID=UPI002D1E81EC|nr:hypothetical protein [Phormidium sp. CCY1219]MEB3827849.1 hypothetical protein [Phormidium sp. CCY1219]